MTASFPTNWDVNRYKADYESDEHWELRKAFIETHKDKFPEDELVCLAQVFTNVEFLGCRYPNKTMERVALLSKDVAAKFRESRDGRLKRTFVGASDAASAKAKGRGSQSKTEKPINQILGSKKFPTLQSSFKKQESITNQDEPTNDDNVKNRLQQSDDDEDDIGSFRPSFSLDSTSTTQQNETKELNPTAVEFSVKTKHTKRIQDTGFIIYEAIAQAGQTSSNILQVSAAKQGATVKFDVEPSNDPAGKPQGVVRINGTVYATIPMTTGKKEAKVQAFEKALEYARKIHYTIKQKSVHNVSVDVEQNDNNEPASEQNNMQLDADNKGFKMMKMLGWSGGALGASGNGIEQPISIEMKVDRSGLGLSSDSNKINYDYYVNYLTKYKRDESATYGLSFSKDFTKEERKTLHEIANRLALSSRSHNTADGSRYIVIFKKLELIDLANEILNNGLRAKCYELIPPTDPLPAKLKPVQKKPPPQNNQYNANRMNFNYKQKNIKRNNNMHPNMPQNKRKKFF